MSDPLPSVAEVHDRVLRELVSFQPPDGRFPPEAYWWRCVIAANLLLSHALGAVERSGITLDQLYPSPRRRQTAYALVTNRDVIDEDVLPYLAALDPAFLKLSATPGRTIGAFGKVINEVGAFGDRLATEAAEHGRRTYSRKRPTSDLGAELLVLAYAVRLREQLTRFDFLFEEDGSFASVQQKPQGYVLALALAVIMRGAVEPPGSGREGFAPLAALRTDAVAVVSTGATAYQWAVDDIGRRRVVTTWHNFLTNQDTSFENLQLDVLSNVLANVDPEKKRGRHGLSPSAGLAKLIATLTHGALGLRGSEVQIRRTLQRAPASAARSRKKV